MPALCLEHLLDEHRVLRGRRVGGVGQREREVLAGLLLVLRGRGLRLVRVERREAGVLEVAVGARSERTARIRAGCRRCGAC